MKSTSSGPCALPDATAEPWAALLVAARTAAGRAYAPYSGFHVGAALRARSGQVYSGCNVECGALPSGGCAERAAIAAAVLAEGAAFRLEALAVVAFSADNSVLAVAPCGACRQALIEFGADAQIAFQGAQSEVTIVPLSALLPHSFELPVAGAER